MNVSALYHGHTYEYLIIIQNTVRYFKVELCIQSNTYNTKKQVGTHWNQSGRWLIDKVCSTVIISKKNN